MSFNKNNGGWERVSSTNKRRQIKPGNKSVQSDGIFTNNRFTDQPVLPKLEDVLPVHQMSSLKTSNGPVKSRMNVKGDTKKDVPHRNTQNGGKNKKPQPWKGYGSLIDTSHMVSVPELRMICGKGAHDTLLEIAYYLNTIFSTSKQSMVYNEPTSLDWKSIKMNAEPFKLEESIWNRHYLSENAVEILHEWFAESTETEIKQSFVFILELICDRISKESQSGDLRRMFTCVNGFFIFLEYMIYAYPSLPLICHEKMSQLISSHINEISVVHALMWVASRPAPSDFNVGVAAWSQVLAPLCLHKPFIKHSVSCLVHCVDIHLKLKPFVQPKSLIQIFDGIHYPIFSTTSPSEQQLSTSPLFNTQKNILFGAFNTVKEYVFENENLAHELFPEFFTRLDRICGSVKSLEEDSATVLHQICEVLKRCLMSNGQVCISHWSTMLLTYPNTSLQLLNYLDDKFDVKFSAIDSFLLNILEQDVESKIAPKLVKNMKNKQIMKVKASSVNDGFRSINQVSKSLLEKIGVAKECNREKARKRFLGFIPWKTSILLYITVAFVMRDLSRAGGDFKKTQMYDHLDRTGYYDHKSVVKYLKLASLKWGQLSTWSRVEGDEMLKKLKLNVQPVLQDLTSKSWSTYAYLKDSGLPNTIRKVDEYLPGTKHYYSVLVVYLESATEKSEKWIQKNGPLVKNYLVEKAEFTINRSLSYGLKLWNSFVKYEFNYDNLLQTVKVNVDHLTSLIRNFKFD